MAEKVHFELVSPERLLASEQVDMVVLPGEEGDFGVLPLHAPVLALLRPGAITREQIERACGERLHTREELGMPDPRASGTLEAHYAPTAKVRLMEVKALQTALDVLGAQAAHIAVWARAPIRSRSQRVHLRRMPEDAAATAQQLFAVLRQFDDEGAKLIWIETPPDTPEWEGVRDRLQRAAAV